MKRFAFSLQRLLDYKEQLFDIERGILAEMNVVLNEMRSHLADLQTELRRSSDELNEKYQTGITALEIGSHKVYLTSVGESIVEQQHHIEMQMEAIDRQADKVREAKIEISTIEKLKEKKLEEYNYQAQKEEELFIDEFVRYQSATGVS
jgi:flagellar FliJ protein